VGVTLYILLKSILHTLAALAGAQGEGADYVPMHVLGPASQLPLWAPS